MVNLLIHWINRKDTKKYLADPINPGPTELPLAMLSVPTSILPITELCFSLFWLHFRAVSLVEE